MKPEVIVITVLVLAISGGLFTIYKATSSDYSTPSENSRNLTVEGQVVCLPHKAEGDVQTLECAIGLQTNKDTYYGLEVSNENQELLTKTGSTEKVRVTGTTKKQENSNYKIDEVIVVSRFEAIN